MTECDERVLYEAMAARIDDGNFDNMGAVSSALRSMAAENARLIREREAAWNARDSYRTFWNADRERAEKAEAENARLKDNGGDWPSAWRGMHERALKAEAALAAARADNEALRQDVAEARDYLCANEGEITGTNYLRLVHLLNVIAAARAALKEAKP